MEEFATRRCNTVIPHAHAAPRLYLHIPNTMRVLLALALGLASVDAATRVAVIELGASSGTVRRTTAVEERTSAEGVASFWAALHGSGRKLQHAGMTVVPDLFSRPESGVVVGLKGVDFDNMPNLNALMSQESSGVVGHMEVHGHACDKMMRSTKNVEQVELSGLRSSFVSQAAQDGISAMSMEVTSVTANDVDVLLKALIQKADEDAKNSGKTVVVHLVAEENEDAAARRPLARRLQDNANGQQNDQQNNGYYGYGYYNSYGEWVTPYKTMFQIQYFNVVLWTSIGLVATLFFSLYLFVYMPLMADTLLFGESAKVAHDD